MARLLASQTISAEIREIKKRKNAIVLAHYYQHSDIQEVADMVSDSLQIAELSPQNFLSIKFWCFNVDLRLRAARALERMLTLS